MTIVRRSRRALLNSTFGKTSDFGALASAPAIHVGLSTTTPTANAANITEATGTGYARVATLAAVWGTASDADPAVIANAAAIEFAAAGGDWSAGANMTHFVLYDAITAGNVVGWGALTTPKPVLNGDTANFAIGAITVTAGNLA